MLPRSRRVTSQELKSLPSPTKKVVGRFFNCLYYATEHHPFLVSVIVSKKVSKKATERNKFRRKIYGVFETISPQSVDGILVVRVLSAVRDASPEELQGEVHETLKSLVNE